MVLDAPLPIRLFRDTIREPDVMYFAPGSEPQDPRSYPSKVELAMEVVSGIRRIFAVDRGRDSELTDRFSRVQHLRKNQCERTHRTA